MLVDRWKGALPGKTHALSRPNFILRASVLRRAGSSQSLDCIQNHFRPCAHSQIFGQIHPTDISGGVHQKLSGPGNVSPAFATLRVEYAVPANNFRCWIGEEREAISLGLAELLRLSGRVHANRNNFHTRVMKLAQMLFETP